LISLCVLGGAGGLGSPFLATSLKSWSVILMKAFIDGYKQKVIAQALGIAQGTVSKVLKRNRETGVPTPRARPRRPRKTTERAERYLLRLCRNGRTKSANTRRVYGYGSLIPLYLQC
jgi:transposase